MSDDSEDEVNEGESLEELNYRRKYQMMLERCEVLQQDNERLVNRIQHLYKYTRQAKKEQEFLIDRLENHGDDWRSARENYFVEALNQQNKIKLLKPRRPSAVKKQGKEK